MIVTPGTISRTNLPDIPRITTPRLATRLLCLAAVTLFLRPQLIAAEDEQAAKAVKELILPGESLLIEGCPSFILLPPKEKLQKPQPWIMYAPTLPGYPDSHEKWMHEQFLAAGARANFEKAGLADVVEVRLGDARQLVGKVKDPVDFLFIDCNYSNYHPCFQGVEKQLAPGAVVVADNVGIGASGMKDCLDYVRSKYRSNAEWFDIDLPWGKGVATFGKMTL